MIRRMTSNKQNCENTVTYQGYLLWSKRTFQAKFNPLEENSTESWLPFEIVTRTEFEWDTDVYKLNRKKKDISFRRGEFSRNGISETL